MKNHKYFFGIFLLFELLISFPLSGQNEELPTKRKEKVLYRNQIIIEALDTAAFEYDLNDGPWSHEYHGELMTGLAKIWGVLGYEETFVKNLPKKPMYTRFLIEGIYDIKTAYEIVEQELSRIFVFSVRDTIFKIKPMKLTVWKVVDPDKLKIHPYYDFDGRMMLGGYDDTLMVKMKMVFLDDLTSMVRALQENLTNSPSCVDEDLNLYDFEFDVPGGKIDTYMDLAPMLLEKYGIGITDTIIEQRKGKIIEFYPPEERLAGLKEWHER